MKLLILFGFIAGVLWVGGASETDAEDMVYSDHYEILKKYESKPEEGIVKLGEQMKKDCETDTDTLEGEQTVSQCRANVGAFVQTYLNADKAALPGLYSGLIKSYEAAMKRESNEQDPDNDLK